MTKLLRTSLLLAALAFRFRSAQRKSPPNIILFVADGLRAAAVSPERAPTFARIRDTGVNFANSHSVLPTITTANASVIATGHLAATPATSATRNTPAFRSQPRTTP